MKILFDENVPKLLARSFPQSYQISRAQDLGWQGKVNGELLRLADEESFDALVTMDKRMRHEQNLRTLPMPVLVLSSREQGDKEYLATLVSSQVIKLLEQGAEKRFYFLGDGHGQPDHSRG